MNDIAIRVENLSKLYKIGALQNRHDTLRDKLTEVVTAPFRRLSSVLDHSSSVIRPRSSVVNSSVLSHRSSVLGPQSSIFGPRSSVVNSSVLSHRSSVLGPQSSIFGPRSSVVNSSVLGPRSSVGNTHTIWAFKDVSFEVKGGEVVGIIGRNGAGKTTLLKILSRITEPTEGSAEIYGRVSSLLEVGTGFHPELTGRENIYLNGAILGMKRAEINHKFDEIVAFAEIEKFIDTPVKRHYPARYMLLVLPWNGDAGDLIPAVNHLGTGRLQTVRREWNPRYYRLVEKFGEATGVPVLMNTSFNLRGEPIVGSPANAWNTFSKSGIDVLVLGSYVVRK